MHSEKHAVFPDHVIQPVVSAAKKPALFLERVTRTTRHQAIHLLTGVAGRAVAFLNVDSLKHRKLELRDENQKSTIFSF